jgi:hypothetical protein
VRQYAFDVRESREELSESTQEHALPPIPPLNQQRKRVASSRRGRGGGRSVMERKRG